MFRKLLLYKLKINSFFRPTQIVKANANHVVFLYYSAKSRNEFQFFSSDYLNDLIQMTQYKKIIQSF